jgi:nicotinamidase-related amidase
MKRNILVVVDMQDEYVKSQMAGIFGEKINAAIVVGQNVINTAKVRGDYIILLQYKGMGDTIGKLRKLVKGYKDRSTVWKGQCDGSGEIRSILKKLGIEPTSFTVFGLYTGECVHDTVEGLLWKYSKPVEIIKKACYSWMEFNWKKDRLYNRKLVRQI